MDSVSVSKNVVDRFIGDLSDGFSLQKCDQLCYIETPFLDPSGDIIEIKAEMINDHLLLSDDGMTLDYLFLHGVELTDNRKLHLEQALNNNSAFLHQQSEIAVKVESQDDYGAAMQRLLRTITTVQHLLYTIKPGATKYFSEEVSGFFYEHNIDHSRLYVLAGKTKEHRIDIYIPGKQRRQPLAIKTLSTEKAGNAGRIAETAAFSFIDLKGAITDIITISLIDDRQEAWTNDSQRILKAYSDHLITWADKAKLLSLVA